MAVLSSNASSRSVEFGHSRLFGRPISFAPQRLVIHRTNQGQPHVDGTEDFGQSDLVEKVYEQIGRGRAAVDHEQIRGLHRNENLIDLTALFEVDEV